MNKDNENEIQTFRIIVKNLTSDEISANTLNVLVSFPVRFQYFWKEHNNTVNYPKGWKEIIHSYPELLNDDYLKKLNTTLNKVRKLAYKEIKSQIKKNSKALLKASYADFEDQKNRLYSFIDFHTDVFVQCIEYKEALINAYNDKKEIEVDLGIFHLQFDLLYRDFEEEIKEGINESPYDNDDLIEFIEEYFKKYHKLKNLLKIKKTENQIRRYISELEAKIFLFETRAKYVLWEYALQYRFQHITDFEVISVSHLKSDFKYLEFEDDIPKENDINNEEIENAYHYLRYLQGQIIDFKLMIVYLESIALQEEDDTKDCFTIKDDFIIMKDNNIVGFHFPYCEFLKLPEAHITDDDFYKILTMIVNLPLKEETQYSLHYATHLKRFKVSNTNIDMEDIKGKIEYMPIMALENKKDAKKYIMLMKKHFLEYLYYDNKKKYFHISRRINDKSKT